MAYGPKTRDKRDLAQYDQMVVCFLKNKQWIITPAISFYTLLLNLLITVFSE